MEQYRTLKLNLQTQHLLGETQKLCFVNRVIQKPNKITDTQGNTSTVGIRNI